MNRQAFLPGDFFAPVRQVWRSHRQEFETRWRVSLVVRGLQLRSVSGLATMGKRPTLRVSFRFFAMMRLCSVLYGLSRFLAMVRATLEAREVAARTEPPL